MHIPETNPKITIPVSSLYVSDFYAWTQEQADLLRNHQWHKIDLQNLIEEIESLGKQQRQELRNRLSILIGHLLKWQFQPQRRSRSWLATLRIQRLDTIELLEENPSLKSYLEEVVGKAYLKGVELAVRETDLPHRTFPSDCPYSLTEILDDGFYPGEASELVNEWE
ncbi:DUF29 domain-containing protein [Sphaerospermopsis aphanizomenoides BCCUSP55]|uniref:DUF29 domain-containing protein n=1 Tax=Sphaerospermopsis aphanizomenoides TaxID=459663 RepID=UPI0019048061|nr:DUF29 domain-containing protein [Sphaerospermopsis aphanizomenoides]MBK1989779.1 DUF29 domain-containing protein [Sphaerospermopsis aphanizomenoides BCCUSP55]